MSSFPATRVSLLGRLRSPDSAVQTEAWRDFVPIYSRIIWCLLVRRFDVPVQEADDLAQEVWRRCFQRLSDRETDTPFVYDPDCLFRNYLITVVANVAQDWRDRRSKGPGVCLTDELDAVHDPRDDLAELVSRLDFSVLLQTALIRIRPAKPGNGWLAFELVVLCGEDHQEVAERLGISRGAVDTAVWDYRKKLRKELRRLDPDIDKFDAS